MKEKLSTKQIIIICIAYVSLIIVALIIAVLIFQPCNDYKTKEQPPVEINNSSYSQEDDDAKEPELTRRDEETPGGNIDSK